MKLISLTSEKKRTKEMTKEVKTPEEIENAYDRHGHYKENGVIKYTAHAVRLEEMTGLTGIAGRYKFLDGKTPAEAEYDYRKAFLKYSIASSYLQSDDPVKARSAQKFEAEIPSALVAVNKEIDKLSKLNPELKKLDYDRKDFIESYRALIGVTSQYNVDDINDYLRVLRTGVKNTQAQQSMESLKKRYGLRFGWQPAVSTLKRIETGMAVLEKARAARSER